MQHQSSHQTSKGSIHALPFALSKGLFILLALILALITISGSSALLTSPIHPIGLVLGILIPAYAFLLFSLIRKHSLFADLLIYLQKQLHKIQSGAQKIPLDQKELQKVASFKTDAPALLRLTKVIMHSAWTIIFFALIISLFFQFTLKQYHFNLFSTLFPYESGFYLTIINILNWLPNLLFGELISPVLVEHSLNSAPSPSENAIWARWIIIMIALYGLFPRLVLLFFAYKSYQHYLKSHPEIDTIQQGIEKLIDPAKVKPTSERFPKAITQGEGDLAIALDYAGDLDQNIEIINDRARFNALKARLESAPLATLTIYLDSSLTPDRSLLRRLYTLMNLSLSNEVILIHSGEHSRAEEWQSKIRPNLVENESISVQSHK